MEGKSATPENQKTMEAFWMECHRLFLGLSVFLKENITHHDLKGQNIVYNPDTRRAAFIDFGLMRPLDAAKSSILLHNDQIDHLIHWSYPVETRFYAKNRYYSKTYKNAVLRELNANISVVYDSAFLGNVLPRDHIKDPFVNRKTSSEALFYSMNAFLESTHYVPFEEFLDKSLETFDLYGMCMGLMYVFIKTFHLIKSSKIDYVDLYAHLLFCIRSDTYTRYTVEDALINYENVLGPILMMEHIIFVNHIPTKVEPPSPSAIRIPSMSEKSLEKSIEQKDKKLLKKVCPPGKIINPLTGRCVKECAPNQQRDAKFRCKTVRLPKPAKNTEKPEKLCPEEKELNPRTNRCVKKCGPNQQRDANFRCKTAKRRSG